MSETVTDDRAVTKSNVQCGEYRSGCQRPAVYGIKLGCVHEHIHWGAMCQHHTERVRAGATIVCHVCEHGPQPHRCEMKSIPVRAGDRRDGTGSHGHGTRRSRR